MMLKFVSLQFFILGFSLISSVSATEEGGKSTEDQHHSLSPREGFNDSTLNKSQGPINLNNKDPRSKYNIIMVRHGESEGNLKKVICGWYDADLSEKGVEEAKRAGAVLKKEGYEFDLAHTSVLTRARKTCDLILQELGQSNIPIFPTWRLNERHFGSLTGLSKDEIFKKYDDDQFWTWMRSFDVPPPPMEESHPYYKNIVNDTRYKDEPTSNEFPHSESLEMTIARTQPYWNDVIVPQIKEGKRILIVAHENCLRGIVQIVENKSKDEMMGLYIPNAIPFVYELDENLKPVGSLRFLGDEEAVAKAIAAFSAKWIAV